ncbi:ABC-type branched-subunit amino acid transport system ATPase component [Streptacidiphilus sp. MAP12-16]|uniref:ABC transporter ATP-binding protein n=1 Tax=Streptacidiphilus sp. MAP12-16 TaxID=3156300 RepID=UPI003517332F
MTGPTASAPAPTSTPTPILEVRDLSKHFGGVAAVDHCSFTVARGTVTGLIGPNGSGKTTVFNLVTGHLAADAGQILLDGRPVTRPDPARLHRRGLCRTFQQPRIFPDLTVLENLAVAAGHPWQALAGPRVRRADRDRGEALLAEFALAAHSAHRADELSYGQRKLLEFAALLMSSPALVLLDEPTAGVNPTMVRTMERHIRERHAAGTTFLVVEHDMNLLMRLCDPVIVLDRGAVIAQGAPGAVQTDRQVLDAYLGS